MGSEGTGKGQKGTVQAMVENPDLEEFKEHRDHSTVKDPDLVEVSEHRGRLDELHYTTNEGKIKHAIAKLQDGGRSFNSLWDPGDPQRVGKGTAKKIRAHLREGKFGFLLGDREEIKHADSVGPFQMARQFLEAVVNMEWTMEELGRQGVPESHRPNLLRFYHRIRSTSEANGNKIIFSREYYALCYEVFLYGKYPDIPVNAAKSLIRQFADQLSWNSLAVPKETYPFWKFN